ncbi:NAD(P)H-hydrate dehydratase [Corynebacterium yudongzhengii]|uniref:NAD(P)H-hydrate dehydratase n=1 Tax=Corynebacterium yudongzhengii TaxID=2080740 RepID=UPI00269BBAD2
MLTPHLGEYDRLAEALGLEAAELNHAEKARRLAQELDCTVLLKGRFTAIADEEDVRIVDTASSWAATPGSGDVMAGMAGAVMALVTARKGAEYATEPLAAAVALHALAARISARMPEGYAPTSASRIAEAIPRASAQLSR